MAQELPIEEANIFGVDYVRTYRVHRDYQYTYQLYMTILNISSTSCIRVVKFHNHKDLIIR